MIIKLRAEEGIKAPSANSCLTLAQSLAPFGAKHGVIPWACSLNMKLYSNLNDLTCNYMEMMIWTQTWISAQGFWYFLEVSSHLSANDRVASCQNEKAKMYQVLLILDLFDGCLQPPAPRPTKPKTVGCYARQLWPCLPIMIPISHTTQISWALQP